MSPHLERRLQDCERIAARKSGWDLSGLTDDELDELFVLQTRVDEPEVLDPNALSGPELKRYRELWAKCPAKGQAR